MVAALLVEGDAGELLFARGAQHVQFNHRRILRIDLDGDLQRRALHTVQHDFVVGRQRHILQPAMLGTQRLDVAGRFDGQLVFAGQGQAAGQAHDLIPTGRGAADINIEDGDQPAFAIGRGGWRMHAAGVPGAEGEAPALRDNELVALRVVIAQEIAPAAHVAEMQQDMLHAALFIADRPEVRTRAIIADQREGVALDKGMQIFPGRQVGRAQQKFGRAPPPGWFMRQRPAGERIVKAILLPDAGVKNVRGGREGDDSLPGHFLPVQEQRIVRDSDHVADLRAVVDGDHAVVFNQRRAGKAAVFWVGVNGIRQVAPVNQIVADGMSPMLAAVFWRVALIEEMPQALPEAQAVRVIECAFRADEMVKRPVRVAGEGAPRLAEALQQRVASQLRLLRFSCGGKGKVRHTRGAIGFCF